ncbi:MAG: RsmB/NOP family class I SAM-dependent RNA methyltransferase [Caldisphaeraceae archaeon]|nr:RsmB/NOP family class I SAM-dependent RNA methyltransferase [Caldisphaeraceae archaeon]
MKASKTLDEKVFGYKVSEEALSLSRRFGYASYIVERYLRLLGMEETEELLKVNEKPMPKSYRCNDFLIACDEVEKRLKEKEFLVSKIPFLPHGYEVVFSPYSLGATHEYMMGYYYIQDPGSMLVAYLLDPRKYTTIVDMAAAPGGKATQILQLTEDSSRLIAVEYKRKRIKALRSNLQRMGFSNYLILRHDARKLKIKEADKILLDSPSSGEGIIRKDPGRRARYTRDDLKKIHTVQYELLNKAFDLVKKGGEVLYAACSTAIEEGEYVIHKVLERRKDVEVLHVTSPIGDKAFVEYNGVEFNAEVSKCIRLWPHRHWTEGFFICKMRRI